MTNEAALTREDILGIDDIEIKLVEKVPVWNKPIYLKSMSASERDSWEADGYILRKKGEKESLLDFRARFLVKCICDKKGNLLFKSSDVSLLSKKRAAALDYLFDIAQEMNGLKAKDIKEMTENLPEGQGEDLPTD